MDPTYDELDYIIDMHSPWDLYDYVMKFVAKGDEAKLEELAIRVDGFPEGCDIFVDRRWIVNAIDCGSLASIKWMLNRNVPLNFRDEEGRSPLHSAIDRDKEDKYIVIELLLKNGASPGIHGFNDWTPLHHAAARDDMEACKLLLNYGADPEIRTRIDDYSTPYEEACILGAESAAEFLRQRG